MNKMHMIWIVWSLLSACAAATGPSLTQSSPEMASDAGGSEAVQADLLNVCRVRVDVLSVCPVSRLFTISDDLPSDMIVFEAAVTGHRSLVIVAPSPGRYRLGVVQGDEFELWVESDKQMPMPDRMVRSGAREPISLPSRVSVVHASSSAVTLVSMFDETVMSIEALGRYNVVFQTRAGVWVHYIVEIEEEVVPKEATEVIVLHVGEQRSIPFVDVSESVVHTPAVASVEVSWDGDVYLFTGLTPGVTKVTLYTQDHARSLWIRVKSPPPHD